MRCEREREADSSLARRSLAAPAVRPLPCVGRQIAAQHRGQLRLPRLPPLLPPFQKPLPLLRQPPLVEAQQALDARLHPLPFRWPSRGATAASGPLSRPSATWLSLARPRISCISSTRGYSVFAERQRKAIREHLHRVAQPLARDPHLMQMGVVRQVAGRLPLQLLHQSRQQRPGQVDQSGVYAAGPSAGRTAADGLVQECVETGVLLVAGRLQLHLRHVRCAVGRSRTGNSAPPAPFPAAVGRRSARPIRNTSQSRAAPAARRSRRSRFRAALWIFLGRQGSKMRRAASARRVATRSWWT